MGGIRYLNKDDLGFWDRRYKKIVLERNNNIIKNLIKSGKFISNIKYTNFERWLYEI